MSDPKNTYYFIVNPRAGSGKTMRKWLPAEKKLERDGIPFVTALTDHKRHATQLAMKAARKGYRKIVSVGGDGSLHETFNGICRWCARTGTPTEEFLLGVVPIGSGNDWIRSLGVPNDTSEVVDLIRKNSVGVMDVVRVKSSGGRLAYMANIGGVGFDSHVCKRVNIQKESGRRGKMIYLNSLRYTIFNLKPVYISVVADGEVIFKKYSPIGEMAAFAAQYAEVLQKNLSRTAIVCDRDSVIAAAETMASTSTKRRATRWRVPTRSITRRIGGQTR